jgi:hypothetical protein
LPLTMSFEKTLDFDGTIVQFCGLIYSVTKLEVFNESKTEWQELNTITIQKLVDTSE